MGFTKYQSVEKVEVVSPKQTAEIRDYVRGVGKVSASQLTDEERDNLPQEGDA